MNRIATVEKVVVNSVMAGCLPEYIPVVIASFEAMLHNEFNLNGIQATTNCISPLAIVSGPVVEQLGLNAGDNVFGGGSRANAAVGRSIRLVLGNIGGGYAGEIDRATFGHPGKYTFCIAENSQDSPWGPCTKIWGPACLFIRSNGLRLRITASYRYRLRIHPQRHRYSVDDC